MEFSPPNTSLKYEFCVCSKVIDKLNDYSYWLYNMIAGYFCPLQCGSKAALIPKEYVLWYHPTQFKVSLGNLLFVYLKYLNILPVYTGHQGL